MTARLRRTRVVLTLTSVALVLVVVLLSLRRRSSLLRSAVSPTSSSKSTCNYVCFGAPRAGNRLGNHLFYLAAVLYVASLTGRSPCIRTSPRRSPLDRVFDLDISRLDDEDRCPIHRFRHTLVYAYNPLVETLVGVPSSRRILLVGSFASWKYVRPIDARLRQSLNFRRKLVQFAVQFLRTNTPPGWTDSSFVRVGVHVRRGDFLHRRKIRKGFTTATPRYLRRALGYFVDRFARIQFVVTSNDVPWCRKNVRQSFWDRNRVNITISEGHSAGQDLALLASCNHTVITTGTYGWWAAWLVNGITVYYANFPRPGSSLGNRSHTEEYYPPNWIGFNG